MGIFCSKSKYNHDKNLIYIKYYPSMGNYPSVEAHHRLLFVFIDDKYSVLEFKKEIEYRHGINAERQVIKFGNFILKDENQLTDYGIKEMDLVILTITNKNKNN